MTFNVMVTEPFTELDQIKESQDQDHVLKADQDIEAEELQYDDQSETTVNV